MNSFLWVPTHGPGVVLRLFQLNHSQQCQEIAFFAQAITGKRHSPRKAPEGPKPAGFLNPKHQTFCMESAVGKKKIFPFFLLFLSQVFRELWHHCEVMDMPAI